MSEQRYQRERGRVTSSIMAAPTMPQTSDTRPSSVQGEPPRGGVRRILIIRPSALGDVCRSVGVLASLKRGYPGAEIDWLVQDTFAPAIASHPDLSRVVPFERRRLARWWRPEGLAALRDFLRGLRAARYDLVVDAQGLARSGLFAAVTEAPRRVGPADARELGWLGYTECVHTEALHTVDRMMLLARVAGGSVGERYDLRLYVGDEDRRWAEQTLGGGGGRMVLLAPTTRWPAKQWPPDRFAALAEALLRDGGAAGVDRVVYVGAAGEREQCRALEALASREPRVVSLLGRTNVGQLMAVIDRAAVVVASDSAALHMAVGLGRPMVGLFGPTRVDLVGPYGHEHDVIQHVQAGEAMDHKRPEIGARQMARITMDEVLAAVKHRW